MTPAIRASLSFALVACACASPQANSGESFRAGESAEPPQVLERDPEHAEHAEEDVYRPAVVEPGETRTVYVDLGFHDVIGETMQRLAEIEAVSIPACADGSVPPTAFGGVRPGEDPNTLEVDVRPDAACEDAVPLPGPTDEDPHPDAETLPFTTCEVDGPIATCVTEFGAWDPLAPYVYVPEWSEWANINRFELTLHDCNDWMCPVTLEPVDTDIDPLEIDEVTVEIACDDDAFIDFCAFDFTAFDPAPPVITNHDVPTGETAEDCDSPDDLGDESSCEDPADNSACVEIDDQGQCIDNQVDESGDDSHYVYEESPPSDDGSTEERAVFDVQAWDDYEFGGRTCESKGCTVTGDVGRCDVVCN